MKTTTTTEVYSRVGGDCNYHGTIFCTCVWGNEGHVLGKVKQ